MGSNLLVEFFISTSLYEQSFGPKPAPFDTLELSSGCSWSSKFCSTTHTQDFQVKLQTYYCSSSQYSYLSSNLVKDIMNYNFFVPSHQCDTDTGFYQRKKKKNFKVKVTVLNCKLEISLPSKL